MADLLPREELPIKAKLQNQRGSEAVPSLKAVRRAHSRRAKATPNRKGPIKGSAAPLVRGHESLNFRRVLVKARIIKMTAYGQKAAALHLRYLDRDSAAGGREKEGFFDDNHAGIERTELAAYQEGEPHQFRLIVSPEDGARLDLQRYSRELMAQVENDLGRKLIWQAVNHYNTDNPHTHIVIHGLDKNGEEVFIDRQYISHGIRHRAEHLATRELGLRMEQEIVQSLQKDVQARHLTRLDKKLLGMADAQQRFELPPVVADTPAHRLQQAQLIGRLTTLQSLGLVQKTGAAHWQLAPDLPQQLQQLARQETGLNRLQQAVRKLPQPPTAYRVHGDTPTAPFEGVVLDRGLSDEMSDRGYLVVADQQGSVHYLEVNNLNRVDAQAGHLVSIKTADRSTNETIKPIIHSTKQGRAVVSIQLLHQLPLQAQIAYPGRTYLDQHYHTLINNDNHQSIPQRLKQAARLRSHWLQQQGMEPGTQASRMALDQLEREAIARKNQQHNGLSFQRLASGESFQGKVLEVVTTPSLRRYVLVGDGKAFAMVPWQTQRQQGRDRQQPLQPGMRMAIGINTDGRSWTKTLGRGLSR